MVVTITATNSDYDFDMGYGGFFSLRTAIATALDSEFGENYALLGTCYTKQQFEKNDKMAQAIIDRKHLDEKYKEIIEFLYMRDSGGEISYKTCRQIHGLIKDIDFGDKGFRYTAYRNNDYEEFKDFLKECYKRHRKMRWS